MAQDHDSTNLAALGEDGVTIICNRHAQDGHVCRYEIAFIPPRWILVGDRLWDLVDEPHEFEPMERKWTGTERVLFFGQGWRECTGRPQHFELTKYAKNKLAHGNAPKYRSTFAKRPFRQGGPLPGRSPRSYPAWAECPRCAKERPGPAAWRMLTRSVLRVVTLAEAARRP